MKDKEFIVWEELVEKTKLENNKLIKDFQV